MPWSHFLLEIVNSATFLQILRVGLQILRVRLQKKSSDLWQVKCVKQVADTDVSFYMKQEPGICFTLSVSSA